jgi:hypothetical protein
MKELLKLSKHAVDTFNVTRLPSENSFCSRLGLTNLLHGCNTHGCRTYPLLTLSL